MNTITENEFKELVKANDTLVLQFSASWCGPCKTLTKTIEANEYKFANPIYKIDLDDNRELASILEIRSVPTLIRFENAEEKMRKIGNQTFEQLLELTL